MSDTPRNAAAPMQSSGTLHAPGCGFGHPTFVLAAAAFVMLQIINTEQLCRAAPLSRSPLLSDFLCSPIVYLGAAERCWWGARSGSAGQRRAEERDELGVGDEPALPTPLPAPRLWGRDLLPHAGDPSPGVPAPHTVVLKEPFMKDEVWFNAVENAPLQQRI